MSDILFFKGFIHEGCNVSTVMVIQKRKSEPIEKPSQANVFAECTPDNYSILPFRFGREELFENSE